MEIPIFTALEGRNEAAFLMSRGLSVEIECDNRRYSFLTPRSPETEAARRNFAADEGLQRFLEARRELRTKMRSLP